MIVSRRAKAQFCKASKAVNYPNEQQKVNKNEVFITLRMLFLLCSIRCFATAALPIHPAFRTKIPSMIKFDRLKLINLPVFLNLYITF